MWFRPCIAGQHFHGFFPVFGSGHAGAHDIDNQIQDQIVTYTPARWCVFGPVVAYENDRDPEIKQQINKLFAIEFLLALQCARAPTRPARCVASPLI